MIEVESSNFVVNHFPRFFKNWIYTEAKLRKMATAELIGEMLEKWLQENPIEITEKKFKTAHNYQKKVNYGIRKFPVSLRNKFHSFARLHDLKAGEFLQVLCEWWMPTNAYINYKTNTRNIKRED